MPRISDTARKAAGEIRRRLVISAAFTIPLFYLGMGHMLGWPLPPALLGDANMMVVALAELLLLVPVLFVNARYFRVGFSTLLFMDLYFEGAGMILTLITLGKWFEARAKGKTTDAIESLIDLAPKTAIALNDGAEEEVPVERVRVGDVLVLKSGASVPVDGTLVDGAGSVDESLLTGESLPVDKGPGDALTGGSIVRSGWFTMEATAVGADTALARIVHRLHMRWTRMLEKRLLRDDEPMRMHAAGKAAERDTQRHACRRMAPREQDGSRHRCRDGCTRA